MGKILPGKWFWFKRGDEDFAAYLPRGAFEKIEGWDAARLPSKFIVDAPTVNCDATVIEHTVVEFRPHMFIDVEINDHPGKAIKFDGDGEIVPQYLQTNNWTTITSRQKETADTIVNLFKSDAPMQWEEGDTPDMQYYKYIVSRLRGETTALDKPDNLSRTPGSTTGE